MCLPAAPPAPEVLALDAGLADFCQAGYAASDDHGAFEMVHGVVGGRLVLGFVGSDDRLDWRLNLDRRLADAPEFDCRLHRGYRDAWRRAGASCRMLVRKYAFPGPVVVCGHSLGGALAQVAAFDLHRNTPADNYVLSVVTFGAPRIWGRRCAAAYPVRGRHYVLGRDPVPRLPLLGAAPPGVVRLPAVAAPSASWWHRVPVARDHALPRYAAALRRLSQGAPRCPTPRSPAPPPSLAATP